MLRFLVLTCCVILLFFAAALSLQTMDSNSYRGRNVHIPLNGVYEMGGFSGRGDSTMYEEIA